VGRATGGRRRLRAPVEELLAQRLGVAAGSDDGGQVGGAVGFGVVRRERIQVAHQHEASAHGRCVRADLARLGCAALRVVWVEVCDAEGDADDACAEEAVREGVGAVSADYLERLARKHAQVVRRFLE